MENIRPMLEQLKTDYGLDLLTLLEQLQTVLVMLRRSVVQQQLAAFGLALILAWLLARFCWQLIKPPLMAWVEKRAKNKRSSWHVKAETIHYILFPIFGLVFARLISYLFELQGWRHGLLLEFINIFWVVLFYRLGIGFCYLVLEPDSMRRYHLRFFMPLLIITLTLWSLSYILSLGTLADVTILNLFSHPVTLGAIFTSTVGLYFWSDGTWVGQDLARKFMVSRTQLDPSTVEATLTIGRYVMLAIGIAIVFSVLGLRPESLALIGGGLSVGIGFGLREVLSNFISGILLMFEQALRPGDIIEVDGELGIVRHLSIRSTIVRTLNNVEVIVPNQIFFTSSVTTYTKTDRKVRILLPVGISYDSDPEQVKELLIETAREHPRVEDNPSPKAFFMNFGESSLDFELAVWLNGPAMIRSVSSDLRFMIWQTFAKHGIEMPFPQRDLHLRSGLPASASASPTPTANSAQTPQSDTASPKIDS